MYVVGEIHFQRFVRRQRLIKQANLHVLNIRYERFFDLFTSI